jgi:DNA-binding NtrC family response regulator
MDLPSVLVVGSDLGCRQTLADVLGAWGVGVIFASTISESRNILLEHSIRLVFCEKHLPGGTFTDLLDAAASRTPPVRVIAILHDVNEYTNAIRLGAFEAILVPCRRSDVQWVIIQAALAEHKVPPDLMQGDESSLPISDLLGNNKKVAGGDGPLRRHL